MKVNTFTQDVQLAEASSSAFYVNGESRFKMTEQIAIRWFKGEHGKNEVFAIYRARFEGSIYLGEEQWLLTGGNGWRKTSSVCDWFFIGKDFIWECTEDEAKSYLPPEAIL